MNSSVEMKTIASMDAVAIGSAVASPRTNDAENSVPGCLDYRFRAIHPDYFVIGNPSFERADTAFNVQDSVVCTDVLFHVRGLAVRPPSRTRSHRIEWNSLRRSYRCLFENMSELVFDILDVLARRLTAQ